MNTSLLAALGLGTLCALTLSTAGLAQDTNEDNRGFRDRHRMGPALHMNGRGSRGPSLARLDTNDDDMVSLEEFLGGHLEQIDRLFERRDQNADGLLSLDELTPPEGTRGRRGPPPEEVAECLADAGVDVPPAPGLPARFEDSDSNGDGFLSHEELSTTLETSAGERFVTLDADGDGFLTREELRARAQDGRERTRELRTCIRASR